MLTTTIALALTATALRDAENKIGAQHGQTKETTEAYYKKEVTTKLQHGEVVEIVAKTTLLKPEMQRKTRGKISDQQANAQSTSNKETCSNAKRRADYRTKLQTMQITGKT